MLIVLEVYWDLKKIYQSVILGFVLLLLSTLLPGQLQKAHAANDPLNLNAKSAILIDANTGKILYEKNADVELPPASMSKMMTEFLVQKYIAEKKLNWNDKVSLDNYAFSISANNGFSGVPNLRQDVQYTVKQLYDAMAIDSDNAATIALAEKIAGSEKNFVSLMNKESKALGLTGAKFVNSTGLNNSDLGQYYSVGGPNDSNVMSARDTAKLAYNLIKDYPNVLQVASTPKLKFTAGEKTPFYAPNWNWMIPGIGPDLNQYSYQGVDGLKTGHTALAGYCFTGTVQRNGRRLISVVMGIFPPSNLRIQQQEGERFLETKKLFDYGFGQFSDKKIVSKGYTFKNNSTVPVIKGKSKDVKIATTNPIEVTVANGEEKNYKPVLHLDNKVLNKQGQLVAPVKSGTKVGYATVQSPSNDKFGYIYSNLQPKVAVETTATVNKASWFALSMQAIGSFFSNLFSGAAHLVTGLFHK